MKRAWEVIDESREVIKGFEKQRKKVDDCLKELQVAIGFEDAKIKNIEQNTNDLGGLNIQELAGPVIRMRGVEEKMKNALSSFRNFTRVCKHKADTMEDKMCADQAAEEALNFIDEERVQREEEMDEMENEEQRQIGQYDDDDSDNDGEHVRVA